MAPRVHRGEGPGNRSGGIVRAGRVGVSRGNTRCCGAALHLNRGANSLSVLHCCGGADDVSAGCSCCEADGTGGDLCDSPRHLSRSPTAFRSARCGVAAAWSPGQGGPGRAPARAGCPSGGARRSGAEAGGESCPAGNVPRPSSVEAEVCPPSGCERSERGDGGAPSPWGPRGRPPRRTCRTGFLATPQRASLSAVGERERCRGAGGRDGRDVRGGDSSGFDGGFTGGFPPRGGWWRGPPGLAAGEEAGEPAAGAEGAAGMPRPQREPPEGPRRRTQNQCPEGTGKAPPGRRGTAAGPSRRGGRSSGRSGTRRIEETMGSGVGGVRRLRAVGGPGRQASRNTEVLGLSSGREWPV